MKLDIAPEELSQAIATLSKVSKFFSLRVGNDFGELRTNKKTKVSFASVQDLMTRRSQIDLTIRTLQKLENESKQNEAGSTARND